MIYFYVIFLYLLILIGIGIVKSRKIHTQSDFALAGRSLTPWILVGTMLATWIGTGSILGNAGKTYEIGVAALMLPIGSILGIILLTKIAGKVRNVKKFTVPEIIGDQYGSVARNLCVFALVSAYMVIVSYQYNAGGAVLYTVFSNQIDSQLFTIETATIIAAIFIISYTMLAGLLSVAFTDAANGILMTISLVIAFPILWIKAGGLNGIELAFESMNKSSHMQFFSVFSMFDIINFCLPPFLLVLGDANMYQRFSASKDHESATKATFILIFAVLIIILTLILKKFEKLVLIFLSLIFVSATIISFYHFGIEQGFIAESLVCDLNDKNANLSKEDLLNELQQGPISCKDVSFRIFGLSLATINTIISFILSIITIKIFKNYEKN